MHSVGLLQFDHGHILWLWVVLAVAGGWLLVSTYRDIFRRSENRLTWFLLGLRGVGLLALLVALAKPVSVRRSVETEPGHVAVVVDDSLSMSFAVPDGQTRYARARSAIEAFQAGIRDASEGVEVVIALHDIRGNPLLDGPPESPEAERTDLADALRRTVTRLRSRHLLGVVLVSDGQDNSGAFSGTSPADLRVPVFTMGFAPDSAADRVDLKAVRVNAPERAILNNTVRIEVLVAKEGGADVEATVRVRRGEVVVASETVAFGDGDSQQIARLDLTPGEAGRFVYAVTVESEAGERMLANNRASFPLQVDEEPIQVVYLEGFLRHEFTFLKRRLDEDPDISLVSVIRRADPGLPAAGLRGELLTPDHLEKFDLVILGDMEGGHLDDTEYAALKAWVEQGNALLVLGGYHSFGPNGFRDTGLAEVVPIVFAEREPMQREEPFALSLTPEGASHPIFEITGDRVQDEGLWGGAPRLAGSSAIERVKPGATVLAERAGEPGGDPAMPVVVLHRFGAGRVLVITADTTWRWARHSRILGQSDTLFSRFWSQAVRWLAAWESDDDEPVLSLVTDRPTYDVGKAVTITATVRRPGEEATAAASLDVVLRGGDGGEIPLRMVSNSADPNRFTGTVYPEKGGRYQVTGEVTAEGEVIAGGVTEFLVHGSNLELADAGIDRGRLQSLARATGGRYVDVGDVAGLVRSIPLSDRRTVRTVRSELWNAPGLFLVFLAAISLEWVTRRKHHLV